MNDKFPNAYEAHCKSKTNSDDINRKYYEEGLIAIQEGILNSITLGNFSYFPKTGYEYKCLYNDYNGIKSFLEKSGYYISDALDVITWDKIKNG